MKSLQRLRNTIARHPRITIGVSLLVLLGGAYLIYNNIAANAPDPIHADIAAATRFLSNDRFMSLTSEQRNAYLNSLGARYLQESPTNRQLIENALKANGVQRSAQRSIAIGMLRQILGQYRGLSSEQKQQRIGMLRTFAGAMGFKGPTVAGLDPAANPVARATGTEQDFQKGMESFTRDLLNELSAEERATLSMMTRDIHDAK